MFNMSGNRLKKQRILSFKSLQKHRLINCLSENHRFFSEYQSLRGFSRLVSKITQECRVPVRVMMADHWRESDCNGSQLISCITAVIFTLFITSSMCSVRFKIFKSVICQHYEVNAHTHSHAWCPIRHPAFPLHVATCTSQDPDMAFCSSSCSLCGGCL